MASARKSVDDDRDRVLGILVGGRRPSWLRLYLASPQSERLNGGPFAHFGDKTAMRACEVSDFLTYSTMDMFNEERNISLPNGLKVTFDSPMERARITYENATPDFSLDCVQEVDMPAAMRSNNKNLGQGMRCTGTVCYEGKNYALDQLAVRGRSWQEPRPEAGLASPPTPG